MFAGGCFWCMEEVFEEVAGVSSVISGFSGGHKAHPSYKEVVGGATGHYEAILVSYDSTKVRYTQLLEVFWHNIDPLDEGGQFCDRGSSYRAAIFYMNEQQQQNAANSKDRLEQQHNFVILTPILPAGEFYPAGKEHQDYARLNPLRYKYYKYACRRQQRLDQLWGEKQEKGLY